jgi:hypothetical protein
LKNETLCSVSDLRDEQRFSETSSPLCLQLGAQQSGERKNRLRSSMRAYRSIREAGHFTGFDDGFKGG